MRVRTALAAFSGGYGGCRKAVCSAAFQSLSLTRGVPARRRAADLLQNAADTPPALRAAVAASATGSAPLRASPKALRALGEALATAFGEAPWHRSPTDARCAPLRWNHTPVRSAEALGRRRLVLPPAGNFSPQKSSQNAPGCGPRTPIGPPRRASPEAASRRQPRSTGPSRPIPPAPSRLRAGQ